MKRMLTGLQPTGVITLGNYIGAIKQMKENLDITVYNSETAVSNTLRYSIESYAYAVAQCEVGMAEAGENW